MAGTRLRALLGAAGLLLALAAAPREVELLAPIAVAAVEEHHAAVIVDTGQTVKKVCVSFAEDAITGAEALRRAGVDPVFASYGEKGEAVCAICGVGCAAGNCFCDRARFWAYHRAAPGGGYTYSRAGVSSTLVRDGDVEGWRWGSGAAPPYASVGQVCGVAEPAPRSGPAETTTTATPAPAGPSPGPAGPEPAPPSGPPAAPPAPARPAVTQPPAPPEDDAPPATVADTSGVADPPAVVDELPEVADGSAPPRVDGPARPLASDRGAGEAEVPSVLSLAAFVVVVGGLVGWRWRLRRHAQVRRPGGVG